MNKNPLMIVFLLIMFHVSTAQELSITNFFPLHNATIDTSQKTINISFNAPIDTSNLKEKIRITGSYTALRQYTYSTTNLDCTIIIKTKNDYYYGEKITVIITNFLTGGGGEIFPGFQWEFNIQPAKQTNPYFSQPTVYNQFWGYELITADINDDGFMDLILDSGQILQNDGQGNFSLYQQIICYGMLAIIITDGDLDGYKEIIVGDAVYEQQDDGFFYYDASLKPTHSDFNNDGYPELVKFGIIPPGDTTNFIGLIYSDGNGGYVPEIDTIVIDKNINGVLNASDFNNDGIRDIAYVTNIFGTSYGVGGENKLVVLYMDSPGDTSYSLVIHDHQFPVGDLGFLYELWAADFNNDNNQDILLITNVEDLIIFNDGLGGFLTGIDDYEITGGADTYHTATVSDINGDGWKGIVYNYEIGVNELGITSIVRNDSSDFSYRPWIYTRDWKRVYSSITADFNGDGALDMATLWEDGLYIHFNEDINSINEPIVDIADDFTLYQNYPNPFNSTTKIYFQLNQPTILTAKIFNINGKEVKTFQQEKFQPGNHSLVWDGKNNHGKEVSSGLYLWCFKSGNKSKTKKIMFVK